MNKFSGSPLHWAAKNGSLATVDAILNSECDTASMSLPDSREKMTPLHMAIANNHEDVVSFLLEQGFYADNVCKNGFKLLHTAAATGNKKVVELVLKYGQKKNDDEDWYIATYLAAFHGHLKVVQMFLDLGVDPNAQLKDYLTLVHAAALGGHKHVLKLLLGSGADINHPIIPPLFLAVLHGHEQIVELLLARGADLKEKLKNLPAIKRESKSKLEEVLTCSAIFSNVNKGVVSTLIHCAAEIGNAKMVKLLLKRGADVNATSDHNHTPLHFAVCFDHEEVVACLLEAGAVLDAGAEDRQPFFTAIVRRNLNIVKLLSMYMEPSDLIVSNSLFEDGLTPLQYAIKVKSLEIVEFLLKSGADASHYVEYDCPLHCAVDVHSQEIVSTLIEHGANIDHVCSNGVTALLHAITENDLEMAKLLIKRGASLNKLNADGSSLLHYAICERLDKKVIRFLVECGADLTQRFQGFLPAEQLIICAMYDHLSETQRLKTENIPPNEEIVSLLKVFMEHGSSPWTVSAFGEDMLRTLFTLSCGMGYFTGIMLLMVADCDFSEGLKSMRRTINAFKARLMKLVQRDTNVFDCYCRDDQVKKFREDSARFRSICYPMLDWVARKESSGMELREEHLWLVNSEFAEDYYGECKAELQAMRNTVISGRITFLDLLNADQEKLAAYARNAEIFEAVNGLESARLFPIFSEDLSYQIEKGKSMKKLLRRSLNVLSVTFASDIPIVVVDKIFSYLNTIDLRNLCRI